MFQKEAKTGNIGKKIYWLPSNSFVPLIHFFLYPNNWSLSRYMWYCLQYIHCMRVPSYVIQQVFNFGVNHPRMIIRYYFLTRSGHLSMFLFTCDKMLMWASDWLIAPHLSRFSWSFFLWHCINFLRYRATSDPNQRHNDRTEDRIFQRKRIIATHLRRLNKWCFHTFQVGSSVPWLFAACHAAVNCIWTQLELIYRNFLTKLPLLHALRSKQLTKKRMLE